MRFNLLFNFAVALFLISCGGTSQRPTEQTKLIPIADFFKNPKIATMRISPNGKFIAYLKPYKKRKNIHIRNVNDPQSERRLTNQTDRDIPRFYWKGNDTILFTRDFGGDENFHIFRVRTDGSGEKDLTPFKQTRASIVDDLYNISKHRVLIKMNKRDKKAFDIYRLNIKNGSIKMIAKNPGNFLQWLTDHRGKLRVGVSSDGVNSTVFYRDNERQKFRPIITTNFRQSFSPLSFASDNKRLYGSSNIGRDKSSIVIFNPKTKKEEQIIYQHPDYDVEEISYSRKRKKITHIRLTTWKPVSLFFDTEFERIYKRLQLKFQRHNIRIVSHDDDESRFIIYVGSDRSLGSYFFYDRKTDGITKLDDLAPWLNQEELVEIKPIKYESRDGLTIHGYLTLPKNRPAKNLPLVVNPHGGPWARDVWGFNPNVQFLANRGYAVLQMNFRGSTGYGRKFWEASFKKWGKEMQNDITDGVQWLIDSGTVDKDRICIFGGSYGGYATLAGLAFSPDLYRCGVDYVGVSNLFTLMNTIPPYWEPMREKLYVMIGHPERDKELLTEVSPVFHADRITAALMVVQGAKDPRVKKAESDQIVAALRKRGIEVPYIVKENEGHGFRNEENRMEFYAEMEKFLRKHLN